MNQQTNPGPQQCCGPFPFSVPTRVLKSPFCKQAPQRNPHDAAGRALDARRPAFGIGARGRPAGTAPGASESDNGLTSSSCPIFTWTTRPGARVAPARATNPVGRRGRQHFAGREDKVAQAFSRGREGRLRSIRCAGCRSRFVAHEPQLGLITYKAACDYLQLRLSSTNSALLVIESCGRGFGKSDIGSDAYR